MKKFHMRYPKIPFTAHSFGQAILFFAGVIFIVREIKELWGDVIQFLKKTEDKTEKIKGADLH